MAKNKIYAALAVASCALTISACSSEPSTTGNQSDGQLAPDVSVNRIVTMGSGQSTQLQQQVSVSDLALRITAADGSYSAQWPSVAKFDPKTDFQAGKYLVEAYYGDADVQGFDCPAFYGSQNVEVKAGETTPVSLTATLANAMVSVTFSDQFVNYMTAYSAEVATAAGSVDIAADEQRPAFVSAAGVAVNVTFTQPSGKTATVKVAQFDAQAAHHYTVNVGLQGAGAGNAAITVTFDDSLASAPVIIDLTNDLSDAPAPSITGVGIVDGNTVNHVIGNAWAAPLKLNIAALAPVKSVKITTSSRSLASQGWPLDLELVGANADTQANLRRLGFDCKGLWQATPGKMAVLDFAGIVSHLTAVDGDNGNNTFTVTATDSFGNASAPFTFTIKATAN